MKKPHALIGLLAAMGTVLGVLVAVVGMPYGRFGGNAFAETYHNNTQVLSAHFAIDCDLTTVGTQDYCIYFTNSGNFSVSVQAHNESGVDYIINALDFEVVSPDDTKVDAIPVVPDALGFDGNPDITQANLTPGNWNCGGPAPEADNDGLPANGIDESSAACFNNQPNGPNSVGTGGNIELGQIDYNIPGGATPGIVPLTFKSGGTGDPDGNGVISCPDVNCQGATIELQEPPPATDTPTPEPTDTPLPTNTPTPVPAGSQIIKVPESCVNMQDSINCDIDVPAANLWICETGPCDGPGEGNLIVFEYARNIATGDQDADTNPDGLGAYEFSVEYDNFVIASVNPSDVVFSPPALVWPGGADGILDGEGVTRGPAECDFSIVTENIVHFGCVTTGPNPEGPLGDMDIARLNLIPHEDLSNDIFPGNNNGVLTVLKDNGCELVDVFGHPTLGSVNGGLTPICGNLAVTVRILEGDLNLDCQVDVADTQLIAFRYGAFFGSLLYSSWFDLEPALHDLDIDIKDIQKVFGRDGSDCQNPLPAQPPLNPPAPF